MIEAVLGKMRIEDGSWLFIENIGNLVCPAEFVIGEDLKIVVVGVTEGSDKPYKYPFIFAKSAACVLTKVDLKAAMDFDDAFFEAGLAAAAPEAALLPLNGKDRRGGRPHPRVAYVGAGREPIRTSPPAPGFRPVNPSPSIAGSWSSRF